MKRYVEFKFRVGENIWNEGLSFTGKVNFIKTSIDVYSDADGNTGDIEFAREIAWHYDRRCPQVGFSRDKDGDPTDKNLESIFGGLMACGELSRKTEYETIAQVQKESRFVAGFSYRTDEGYHSEGVTVSWGEDKGKEGWIIEWGSSGSDCDGRASSSRTTFQPVTGESYIMNEGQRDYAAEAMGY